MPLVTDSAALEFRPIVDEVLREERIEGVKVSMPAALMVPEAYECGKPLLVLVHSADSRGRHRKMFSLLSRSSVVRNSE